jgi:hypothetical protein
LVVGFGEDLVGGLGPDDGVGSAVAAVDEAAYLAGELADAAEGRRSDLNSLRRGHTPL